MALNENAQAQAAADGQSGRGTALALLFSTLAMAASFVIWNLFSPLASKIQEQMHLSTMRRSVLIATPVLLGALGRIPMGIYTDPSAGAKCLP